MIAEGRIRHLQLTGFSSALQWAYAYDGDGLRMSKSHDTPVGRAHEYYTWDETAGVPQLLQDATANYLYGPLGLLAEIKSDGTTYYDHPDQLGSVRALTDGTGAVVNRYQYDAYGNVQSSSGSAYNPFGSAGA